MKTFLLALMVTLTTFITAMAADSGHAHGEAWLKPTEAQYVCMMNNKVFDKPQIATVVEGKTYYGCCPMCADKLKNDISLRTATDPISSKSVDKASAVIGADTHGMTYYFENKENFDKFASGPMPTSDNGMKTHEMKDGMMMQGGSE
jgi:YHS domain-containing protein